MSSHSLLDKRTGQEQEQLRRESVGTAVRSNYIHRSILWDLTNENQFIRLDDLIDGTVHVKIEGCNPAGSIKLKTALSLVESLEDAGRIGPGTVLIESSSGNLGAALAMVAAQRGYPFVCVVDPNTTATSRALMQALGTRVVCVTERDENGGYLGTRIRYIQDALARDPSYVWLNQYANPANPAVHERVTGPALLAGAPGVEHVFIGAGTTGTLMGCARFFHEHHPQARIVAVDTMGSVTFGAPPGKRRIPGLGTSRRPEICDADLVDDVVFVSEADAIRMCRRIARRHGILFGGSTGTVLAGIEASRHRLNPGAIVATIAPDLGERYLGTIYDDSWVAEHYPDILDTNEETTPC